LLNALIYALLKSELGTHPVDDAPDAFGQMSLGGFVLNPPNAAG
jgi:hypothetical protein